MFHQLSTIRRMGIAVVLACGVALPASVWAAPPSSNPGQPFAEVLAQIGILNDKLNELLANDVDLRGVTQNWDKKLDSTNGDVNGCNSDRFTCVLDGQAVRDNETGIVWDRSPSGTTLTWKGAIDHCFQREVGGRKGWHLPMMDQLASLVDTSNNDPTLPTDHPFQNVQTSTVYWATTKDATDPTSTWSVWFKDGSGHLRVLNSFAWCARGGQSYDGQDVNAILAP